MGKKLIKFEIQFVVKWASHEIMTRDLQISKLEKESWYTKGCEKVKFSGFFNEAEHL